MIQPKKNINFGISILRVVLSIMVIFDHFYDKKQKQKFIYILYYHIPTFFVLSFYYTHNTFSFFNITKIKARFARLVIPYFGWSSISFIIFNIYYYILNKNCSHSFYSFLVNLLSGRIYLPVLWFQNVLIFATLFISIIVLLNKTQYLLIFLYLVIISYILQYSGINYYFFTEYFEKHYYYTYGRIIEILPNAISGFYLNHLNIEKKIKSYKTNTLIISLLILLLFSKYQFDVNLLSFKYGGLRRNISSICIFIFFLSFSFYFEIKNEKINNLFVLFTRYTAGIYFSHCLIGRGEIIKLILNKNLHSISGCLSIYLISFNLTFICDKLFGKTFLRHLFK